MFKFFLYAILLSPVPFGSNRPWAWSFFAVVFALTGLIIFASALCKRSERPLSLHVVKYPFYLACIPVAWSVFQLSNLAPMGWTHPFWQLAAEQLPGFFEAHISVMPQETATALMKLLSYFLVFFISLQFNRNSENTVLTFKSLAYAGLIYAIYGLVIYLGHFDTLLWFDKWSSQDSVTSTFVNRNSYATYAGLTLLCGLPLVFDKIQSCFQYGVNSHYGRQYFFEHVFIRGWFPLLIIIMISTALFLSQSRGGFSSTTLAVAMFFIILLLSRRIKNNAAIITFLIVIGITSLGVLWQSGDKIIDRLDATSLDNEGRFRVYEILYKANAENRWFGVGYGSFFKSFRLYRDESIIGYFDMAHNTYLENIFELGLLQAAALFISIAIVALICLRGVWVRRKHWIYPAIGFSASILVGAHALVDFSLQMPAVAYTYALIMGAATAQAIPSRKK